jgi:hypothetical protein
MGELERSDNRQVIAIDPRQFALGLLHPSTLILLMANAIPVVGVVFWGWDAFVLLMLYWLETAVIGFWMVVRIATIETKSIGQIDGDGPTTWKSAIAVMVFFAIFTTLLVAAFFHFLWQTFADKWSLQIHSMSDFIDKLVIDTGMWLPLLVLFLARGGGFLIQVLTPELLGKFERAFNLPTLGRLDSPRSRKTVAVEFLSRIIVISMTIFLTIYLLTFISLAYGNYEPQIMLIVGKTIADIFIHVKLEFGSAENSAVTMSAARYR